MQRVLPEFPGCFGLFGFLVCTLETLAPSTQRKKDTLIANADQKNISVAKMKIRLSQLSCFLRATNAAGPAIAAVKRPTICYNLLLPQI